MPEKVARGHLRLVHWYVGKTMRQFHLAEHHREDLTSIGMLAMVIAWSNYNPERGKFSTWAGWRIWSMLFDEAQRLYRQDRRNVSMDDEEAGVALRRLSISGPDLGPILLEQAIERMPAEEADLIREHYYKGISLPEIATRTPGQKKRGRRKPVTTQTMVNRRDKALTTLRRLLQRPRCSVLA